MDEAEATAAMFALGPPVEWVDVLPAWAFEERSEYGYVSGVHRYFVGFRPYARTDEQFSASSKFGAWDNLRDDSKMPIFFETRDAARDACEQHYISGKWQSV